MVDSPDEVWKGFAFEALIHHELRAHEVLSNRNRPLFHYAVSGSFDVDFLLQTRPKTLSAPRELIAIEVKSGDRFKPAWTSGLKTLLEECPESVRRGIVVYQGTDHLVIDGIDILPAAMFLERLHADRLLVAAE